MVSKKEIKRNLELFNKQLDFLKGHFIREIKDKKLTDLSADYNYTLGRVHMLETLLDWEEKKEDDGVWKKM